MPSLCTVVAVGLLFGLIACTSIPPAQDVKRGFSGAWSVQWCSKTDPSIDCGGFNVSLVQRNEAICGDFGGALVSLR